MIGGNVGQILMSDREDLHLVDLHLNLFDCIGIPVCGIVVDAEAQLDLIVQVVFVIANRRNGNWLSGKAQEKSA